jgi:hypothetical protein
VQFSPPSGWEGKMLLVWRRSSETLLFYRAVKQMSRKHYTAVNFSVTAMAKGASGLCK